MINPFIPHSESARLDALERYLILDTQAEQEFDDLAHLAAQICETPISAISFIDQNRQWTKAMVGLTREATARIPRETSFCAHTILSTESLVIPDTVMDERFATHPLVDAENPIRFYAGIPLITPHGLAVGSLCVVDTRPRELSPQQLESLERLGRQVVALLENRLDTFRVLKSENRFRRLFETSQDGILILDGETGQVEHVNPAFCQMVECTLADCLGRHFDELDTFREVAVDKLTRANLTAQDNIRLDNIRIQTKGGNELIVDILCNVFAEGEERIFQCNVRDITERTRAEDQLRESEEHLRLVIEASNDGVWNWDIVTNAVTWSERIYTILGLSPEQFEPTFANQLALVHPDDVEGFLRAIERHTQTDEPYNIRVRYRHSDGHYRTILARGQLQRTPDGQPLRMLGSFSDLTLLVQVEAEREQKSRDILAIWEHMTDAFFSLDLEWRFTHVNRRTCEIWDKVPADLIGQTLWEVFPAAVGTEFQRQYVYALQSLTPVVFEAFYAPRDTWREVHAYPSPLGLGVYFRDISERKATQDELRRSESLFRTLIDKSWDAFHLVTAEGEILFESPTVTRMLGYLPEEMVGHNTTEFTHPDYYHHLAQNIPELLATPNDVRVAELQVMDKDGAWRWIESCNVNLLNHPDVGAVAVNYRDITERKHAEEERDRFFTTSLDMLAVVGMDGYFRRLNPTFSVSLGFSESELLARPFIDWVHPDDQAASLEVATALNLGQPLIGFENRYLRSDGSWCWIEWKAVSFPAEQLIYAAARDITQRKAVESSLQEMNEELERRVNARTTELAVANEALQVENLDHQTTMASLRQVAEAYRASQQEAEAASKAKSEFMSHMSHELRTPLNAILGFGQILQSAHLRKEENEQVEQILSGGWHLLDLIDGILDISRVEAGKLELELDTVPLLEVLQESCALVGPLAAQRGVSIEFSAARSQEFYVVADRQRLKQVLINLISNGIKYNREKGNVSFHIEPDVTNRVRLGVRDTGEGLSLEDQAKLFVPFERLGASKAGIDGTGLGLVLSKHLLSSMGGGLEIESTPGTGSTFWVELPTSLEEPLTIGRADSPSLPLDELKREPHAYRILSIEDDISSQRLMQQLLSCRAEIDFRGAPAGQAGLRLAFELRPDLILVNLNLPDMPGLDVLQQLRRNSSTQDIPVIIVSAEARQPKVESILAEGAADYLIKPYTVTQMMSVINKALLSGGAAKSTIQESALVEDHMPRALRVLVAEDNLINQKIIAHQLKKMGCEVDFCPDGQGAVEAWKSGQYDLILMDCRMPNMDGYEATMEIRRLEQGQERTPIIALTASALAEDKEKSLACGMDDHLSKPINQARLSAALQRWQPGHFPLTSSGF